MIDRPVGVSGTVAGADDTSTQSLVPMAVTVATRRLYGVPLTSSVTTTPTSTDTPSSNVAQVVPPSLEMATT